MSTVYAVAPRPATLAVPLSSSTPTYVNPAQMQNAQAGPSTQSQTAKKKSAEPVLSAKRKRTDTPDDTASELSGQQPRKARDGPKKKKANRACFHCQKAHLTCDDSRPCQRCIKRGIANNCTEGHRKKAKYLLDDEELEALKRTKSSGTGDSSEAKSPQSEPPAAPAPPETFAQPDSLLGAPFDPNFSFGSEAANLEYSILSAILGNPSPSDSSASSPPPPPPPSYSSWPSASDSIDFSTSPRLDAVNSNFGSRYNRSTHRSTVAHTLAPFSNPTNFLTYPYTQPQRPEEIPDLTYPLHPLQPRYPLESRPKSPVTISSSHDPKEFSTGLLSPPSSNASPSSTAAVPSGIADLVRPQSRGSKLQSINDRVTAPYDYTEGYHFLMKHLPTRFEKNDILRIVRALAIFRPSLIALQMPLSLDDEVFVEKCFQRSLLELEKLISFSGTPTVVWRRTGEICLVAPEFCMLTEWPMEELIGKKKYIYEATFLLENQSVVEYWENFASHAFENTTRSVYSHCVLLKPSGAPVPTTFCFSIRRDLFDLPSMVIGQWLPLL
ncbi:transcription activator of gluconeogenesis ERT1 [Macrolepiota fuliginosa MF-IS2]|uniref:Transcription activator of gluconeogenesis ERT1 n=1 Tax=Macrolepiota fuliginosa MF-IS2 TaxID=1400762 RepID=A0A9P5XP97_9AGAR|nr:transcription activator of gluconeogenesis ERT1 [Macrolepiota fuliginosa MF-IS2]